VAANYVEANNAVSRADFSHRIGVVKKEANESLVWIRLLGETSPEPTQTDLRLLYREADELTRIFGAIRRKITAT
jgi:four helix bundle protein